MTSYPKPWPGYTVPEFGGPLNALGDDLASTLAAVVADAQATQSIHRDMIQHMADWEARSPGILNSDDDLRNTFIANLEGLRSAFTDRALGIVGISFPMMLDRTDPSHAVIIAVRDDIADTRDRLQAKRAQELVAKQVADTRIGVPELLARQAAQAAADAAEALKRGATAGGEAVKDFAKTLAWILGGGFGLYLVTQMTGGKK